MSPSWSFRNGSPFRRWRRLWARTTNTSFTSWPSARSRTKQRVVGVSVVCSIGTATVSIEPDGLASPRMGVLIAGGTGALGSAVVRELLDAGYDCTVTWIVEKELERARQELGDGPSFVRADLIDPAGGADAAVASVDDLEAVVDLVGGFSDGPLVHETSWDDFERML